MDIVKRKIISNSKPLYIVIRVFFFDLLLNARILLCVFRTLPFDKLIQRAAEEKHKEFFMSEVIDFNIL